MSNDIITRLYSAIDKFNDKNDKSYDIKEFHSSIESIIHSITEADLGDLREKLLKFESELEYIDFMVDKTKRRDGYSRKISDLIEWLVNKYTR
jgi:hypothetical protein